MQKFRKAIIKNYLKEKFFYLIILISPKWLTEYLAQNIMSRHLEISHKEVTLKFHAPNSLNIFRIKTFSDKEPETLNWIDDMPKGAIFWDIGANIGLYSCYAAKLGKVDVIAFEPSVFNLELLARNIYTNDLTDKIVILPLAIADKIKFSKLKMTTTTWGGALSTFSESYGFDGKDFESRFSFQTMGISLDECVSKLNFKYPNYIKLDVDGIEHLILSNAINVLSKVDEVLVEVNKNFSEQRLMVEDILTKSNLMLMEAHTWPGSLNTPFENSMNQIWIRRR